MRLKITLLFAFLLLMTTNTYAGFPVTRNATTATTSVNVEDRAEIGTAAATSITSPAAVAKSDKFTTALLLWLFLWPFAAHRWYLGSPIGWNILFIVTFGGLGIWAIIDLIDIITEKYPGL